MKQTIFSKDDILKLRKALDTLIKDQDEYCKRYTPEKLFWEQEIIRLCNLLRGRGIFNEKRKPGKAEMVFERKAGRNVIIKP